MTSRDHGAVLKGVRTLFDSGTTLALGDRQLLERFLLRQDEGAEAAFSALVERHGPMVQRVCWGVLHDMHAAEDAFQATFLILARKAATIRRRGSISSWLFGVAHRVARRANVERNRRIAYERRSVVMAETETMSSEHPPELVPEIQEEVDRLPEKYRGPIVLCYLEGLTHEEAASQLGLPTGTVKVRLMRARERLRGRLIRRGLAPALLMAALAGKARAAIPPHLMNSTVKAALEIAAGRSAAVSAVVAVLVQGVINAMFVTKLKTAALLLATSLAALVGSILVLSAVPNVVRSQQLPAAAREGAKVSTPKSSTPATENDVRVVAVRAVEKGDFSRAKTYGAAVTPYVSASLYAKVSGFAKSIAVDIGDTVKRGQVLAEISVPELLVDLERSKAVVEQTEARAMKTKSLVLIAESAIQTERVKIEVARSQLEQAVSSLRFRQKQYDRLEALVKRGDVDQRLLDENAAQLQTAKSGSEAATAQVAVAKAELAEADAKWNATQIDVREATADLKVAMADLAKAKVFVDYTRIVAPWDGVVTKRTCSEGDFIRSGELGGSDPIFTVVKTGKVRVIVRVPDSDVPYLDKGDLAEIHFDALTNSVYRGTVARIAPTEEPINQTIRTEIDVENADGRLKPGQNVRATIHLQNKHGVHTIPSSAVFEQNAKGEAVCYRIENGRAVLTRIKIGEDDGKRTEVIEGLKEGERVITQADGKITDGQEIVVKEGAEPSKK